MSSFRQFLAENKLWWMLPIVIVLALVGWMLVNESMADQEVQPFVYEAY